MHIIIGGCGRVGAELAGRLSQQDHDVVVVDHEAESLEALGSGFNGQPVLGDLTDEEVLLTAGVDRADAFAAVTSSDNANLMAVEIAVTLYGVQHTVARLFDPQRETSYRKMGVHFVTGTRLLAKTIINELHAGTFPLHVAFEEGDIEVVEMVVKPGGHGTTVAAFEANGHVRVAALQRGRRVRLATPDTQLQAGDLLVVAARKGAHRRLRDLAANPLTEPATQGSER